MKVELKSLELSDAEMLYEFFQQLPASENGRTNTAYGLSRDGFSEWVKQQIDFSYGKNLPEGYVPCTTYVLYIDDVPVGTSSLRHHLCPSLERDGGHIGTQILPKYRGKGYGIILLKETMRKAKEMGIDSVLVFNHHDNEPAWRSSERLGGRLDSINDIDGDKVRKYVFDMVKRMDR